MSHNYEMAFLAFCFFIAGISCGIELGAALGEDKGYKQYHKGEIVCETRLSGEIECIKRKDVK